MSKNNRVKLPSKKIIEQKLEKALNSVAFEKYKNRDGIYFFLRHLVCRGYDSDTVAIALGRKLVPDKTENEETGDKRRDIYSLINQIQQDVSARGKPSLELDKRDGLDKR